MTTLTGNTVYEYLNKLETQVRDLKESNSKESSIYRAHNFFGSVVSAEREFLKQVNNGSAMISILGNGMPSIESLAEDIKSMGKLEESVVGKKEDLELFERISKGYTNSLEGISSEEGPKYKTIESEDFEKQLKRYREDGLTSKISYSIKDKDDKFELVLRESFFIEGYDEHSKKFPVAVRESTTDYQVVWNNLIAKNEEKLYVPLNNIIVKTQDKFPTISEKIIFNDISIRYGLGTKYFQNVSVPGLFRTKKTISNDFEELVRAGANTRIKVTNKILAALNKTLDSDISINDDRGNLTEILASNNFKSAHEEQNIAWWYSDRDFILDNNPDKKVGYIRYGAPKADGMGGSIEITINSSVFKNKKQYIKLQRRLKPYWILPR